MRQTIITAAAAISGCATKRTVGCSMALIAMDSAMLMRCEMLGVVQSQVDVGAFWISAHEAAKEVKFRKRDNAKMKYPEADTVAIPDLYAGAYTYTYDVNAIAYKCFGGLS
ncbi:hypothetical protein L1D34_23195 [Vibrio mediterranei]|jgi:hypothetical protein|uniref:hypothetical protein n=1 Tax=Vibrio mediterranei TaxID=689 RepID=UPI001EFD1BC5|nr:hypothetical protein [Vibrio mediterranei]MCG9627743.1 hypothetical protein [Vibrio mediterranei]MCY9855084.1 hypothetical protein [Vibrio mediterranei]